MGDDERRSTNRGNNSNDAGYGNRQKKNDPKQDKSKRDKDKSKQEQDKSKPALVLNGVDVAKRF